MSQRFRRLLSEQQKKMLNSGANNNLLRINNEGLVLQTDQAFS